MSIPTDQRSLRARRAPCAPALLALLAAPALAGAPALPQGPEPAAVRVDAVRAEVVQERRQVTGSVRAVRRSLVASQESGLLIDLLVREGQSVTRGSPLARLDSTRLELELATLEAQRSVAEAILDERTSDEERRRRDLESLRVLAERDAARPKELADAESDWRVARARVAQARRDLEVIASRAALARVRVEDTTVAAPFAGMVSARHTEVGQWLSAGDAVVELISVGELEVWLDVPQEHYAALAARRGALQVRIDATGDVYELEAWRPLPLVAERGRSFTVIAGLPPEAPLAPGMSVSAAVPTGAQAAHATVSPDAILRNETGPYVYLVVPGGEDRPARAAPVQVEILFRTAGRVVVRGAGLAAGALTVVEGNERLYPMAPVVPVAAERAAGTDRTDQTGQADQTGQTGQTGSAVEAGGGERR